LNGNKFFKSRKIGSNFAFSPFFMGDISTQNSYILWPLAAPSDFMFLGTSYRLDTFMISNGISKFTPFSIPLPVSSTHPIQPILYTGGKPPDFFFLKM